MIPLHLLPKGAEGGLAWLCHGWATIRLGSDLPPVALAGSTVLAFHERRGHDRIIGVFTAPEYSAMT